MYKTSASGLIYKTAHVHFYGYLQTSRPFYLLSSIFVSFILSSPCVSASVCTPRTISTTSYHRLSFHLQALASVSFLLPALKADPTQKLLMRICKEPWAKLKSSFYASPQGGKWQCGIERYALELLAALDIPLDQVFLLKSWDVVEWGGGVDLLLFPFIVLFWAFSVSLFS